uniref:GON-4-like protein n=2 Tax=Lygus hesperus TaxID=30085 RepID=A0A0A9Z7S8_LYGHE
MVDEELEDLDNEELRIDRAVKISRKEVEDLMSELFEYTQMHEDGFNSDDESCVVEPVEVVDDLIITQMELKSLRDASPCSSSSIFSFPTLQSSLDLMSEYDTFVQSNKVALNRWNQLMASKPSYKKTVHEGSPGIHPHLMSLCLKSDAFQYPLLLPKMGFKSCPFPQRNRFSEAEDRLVAFGLEDCEHNLGCNLISNRDLLEASDLIRRSLIPVKTAESICQHILKRRNSKFPNTIQDYFLFRKAPGIEHFVVPIDFSQGLLPLFQLDVQLIDVRWHRILYLERERQMLLEENVKKEEVSSTTPELTEPVPVTTN